MVTGTVILSNRNVDKSKGFGMIQEEDSTSFLDE